MKHFLRLFLLVFIASCSSKKEEGVMISDATLFSLTQTVSSFTYLNKSLDTLAVAGNSPHGGHVRVRFNQKAVSAMNDSATRLTSTFFPDESLIVKEVYGPSGGPLLEYSVMYKFPGAANSGSGRVWAEFHPDGTAEYSSAEKGGECISCHSASGNNDLVQIFRFH